MTDDVLYNAISVFGNTVRITARQWAHVTEAHDYMSGNIDKVLETLSEPERVIAGQHGESLALRHYDSTNITSKTAVVVYRDEVDGFLITAFFTSKPDRIEKKGDVLWSQSPEG
jgi:hypothetical protein